MEKKILTISLEKARKLYKNGSEDMKSLLLESFNKEELENLKLPKTWEEYCKNHYRRGYYLNNDSTIHPFLNEAYNINLKFDSDKNTFESKENAEAVLALCQLIRLRDEYNGHKPVDSEIEDTYAIEYDETLDAYDIVSVDIYSDYKCLFTFHNEELAQEFLKNFKPLLDKFYKIMY